MDKPTNDEAAARVEVLLTTFKYRDRVRAYNAAAGCYCKGTVCAFHAREGRVHVLWDPEPEYGLSRGFAWIDRAQVELLDEEQFVGGPTYDEIAARVEASLTKFNYLDRVRAYDVENKCHRTGTVSRFYEDKGRVCVLWDADLEHGPTKPSAWVDRWRVELLGKG